MKTNTKRATNYGEIVVFILLSLFILSKIPLGSTEYRFGERLWRNLSPISSSCFCKGEQAASPCFASSDSVLKRSVQSFRVGHGQLPIVVNHVTLDALFLRTCFTCGFISVFLVQIGDEHSLQIDTKTMAFADS